MTPEKPTYESTLKFTKEEEILDRFIYRPGGYQLALFFNKLRFTPNAVTIISIFVGLAGSICFFFEDFTINLAGVLLLITANFLDCADGQLARMTKNSTRIGRILDGFAGDVWFINMYFMLAFRCMYYYDLDAWVFIPIVASGISHAKQAGMADFFKNVHLYFVKGGKGGEIDTIEEVTKEYDSYSSRKNPFKKFLLGAYIGYTKNQREMSTEFSKFQTIIADKYNGVPPADLVQEWTKKNRNLLYFVHALSFNGRTMFLFPLMLLGIWWYYIPVELIGLNAVLYLMIKKYEKALKELNNKLLSRVA